MPHTLCYIELTTFEKFGSAIKLSRWHWHCHFETSEQRKKEWNERGTKERKEPATEKKLASIRLDSISNLYLKPFYMKFRACPISKSAIQLLTRDHQIGLIRTERTYVFLLLSVCVWKHLNVVLIIIITMSLHSIRQENTWRRRKAIATSTWCYP